MKINCTININLEDIKKENDNQFLNNDKVYEHISKNIHKINLLFENIETNEVGNRGFLSQLLEQFNQKS